jgi:hypothetical protein
MVLLWGRRNGPWYTRRKNVASSTKRYMDDGGDERLQTALHIYIEGGETETRGKSMKDDAKDTMKSVLTGEHPDMDGIEIRSETAGKWRFHPIVSVRKSLSPELLLQNGVSSDVIAKCTVESESVAWRVDRVKGD